MHFPATITSLLGAYIVGTLAAPAPAPAPATPQDNVAIERQLQQAASIQQKLNILLPDPSKPDNLTFQFVNNTVSAPTGGTIALAEINAFPALELANLAMAIGFVNACGLNVPHNHPRASEMLTVVQGKLEAGLVLDNNTGGTGNIPGSNQNQIQGPGVFVNTTLENYKGLLFPQGETHFQFNPTCEPAVFAAAFDNRDPGRSQIAQAFFTNQPDTVLEAALGPLGKDTITPAEIDKVRSTIPRSFAVLIDDCAQRCGIKTN